MYYVKIYFHFPGGGGPSLDPRMTSTDIPALFHSFIHAKQKCLKCRGDKFIEPPPPTQSMHFVTSSYSTAKFPIITCISRSVCDLFISALIKARQVYSYINYKINVHFSNKIHNLHLLFLLLFLNNFRFF